MFHIKNVNFVNLNIDFQILINFGQALVTFRVLINLELCSHILVGQEFLQLLPVIIHYHIEQLSSQALHKDMLFKYFKRSMNSRGSLVHVKQLHLLG